MGWGWVVGRVGSVMDGGAGCYGDEADGIKVVSRKKE